MGICCMAQETQTGALYHYSLLNCYYVTLFPEEETKAQRT